MTNAQRERRRRKHKRRNEVRGYRKIYTGPEPAREPIEDRKDRWISFLSGDCGLESRMENETK